MFAKPYLRYPGCSSTADLISILSWLGSQSLGSKDRIYHEEGEFRYNSERHPIAHIPVIEHIYYLWCRKRRNTIEILIILLFNDTI